jgi:hypothetical protein
MREYVHPGNSHGYQNRRVTESDCWKLLKTKERQSRRQNAESRKGKSGRSRKVASGAAPSGLEGMESRVHKIRGLSKQPAFCAF